MKGKWPVDSAGRPVYTIGENESHIQWTQQMAMKLIRDSLDEANVSNSFFRNTITLYMAITELVAMHGNGFVLRTSLLSKMTRLEHHTNVGCREFLENIGLVKTEVRMMKGKKTLVISALPAPFDRGSQTHGESSDQDTKNAKNEKDHGSQTHLKGTNKVSSSNVLYKDKEHSQKANSKSAKPNQPHVKKLQPDSSAKLEAISPLAAVREETKTRLSVLRKAAKTLTASRDPSLPDTKEPVVPSLKGWSHEMIAAHHQEFPDSPPVIGGVAVRPEQALACAVVTLPGWEESPSLTFGNLFTMLSRMTNKGFRGLSPGYTPWMEAALSLQRFPVPEDGVPSMPYFIASITNAYRQVKSRAWEARHEEFRHGEKPKNDGKEHVTWSDIEIAAQEAGIEI
jgi:hypothetical protein